MHILDVLESIRSSALSEYEKGRKFEKSIQAWLLADPVFSAELAQVWLWEQFHARWCYHTNPLILSLWPFTWKLANNDDIVKSTICTDRDAHIDEGVTLLT